jgi:hypothetical protein
MKSSVVSAWSDGDNYLLCIFYGLRFYNMGLCNFFLFFFCAGYAMALFSDAVFEFCRAD